MGTLDSSDGMAWLVSSEPIEATRGTPMGAEPSLARTTAGLLLAVRGGLPGGAHGPGIWLYRREDEARRPATCVARPAVGGWQCWRPELLDVSDDLVALVYREGPGQGSWQGAAVFSSDGGRTWTRPVPLPPTIWGPGRQTTMHVTPDGLLHVVYADPAVDARLVHAVVDPRRLAGMETVSYSSELSARVLSPDAVELDLRRKEMVRLRDELVDRERVYGDLKDRVDAFVHHRLLALGDLYVEIDRLGLELAETLLSREPRNPVLQRRVQEARARVAKTQAAVEQARETGPLAVVLITREVREAYHAAARKMHPDLARTEEERELRHRFMAELNAAYDSGDLARIHEIEARWDANAPVPPDEDTAKQLRRVNKTIDRLTTSLAAVEDGLRKLRASSSHVVMMQTQGAARQGEDPLVELRQRLETRIEQLRREIDEARDRGADGQ